MKDLKSILDVVQQRPGRRKGIMLASDYLGALKRCFDDATCAACREDGGPSAGQDYFGRPTASEHPEYWQE